MSQSYPTKLQKLMESEGYVDMLEFLENCTFDSINPGICTNPDCDYTCEVEPDQGKGWCENCEKNTVKSALVLAGII